MPTSSKPSQCNDSWLSTIHLFKCASDFSNGIINIPTKQGKNNRPSFSTPHKLEGGSLLIYNLQFLALRCIAQMKKRSAFFSAVLFSILFERHSNLFGSSLWNVQMKLKFTIGKYIYKHIHTREKSRSQPTQRRNATIIKDINNSKSTLLSAN